VKAEDRCERVDEHDLSSIAMNGCSGAELPHLNSGQTAQICTKWDGRVCSLGSAKPFSVA
jgi:hypothetical protein